MPKEGVFFRVNRGGEVSEGDPIQIINPRLKFAVLTASDKATMGKRADTSGPALERLALNVGGKVVWYRVVPDEISAIEEAVLDAVSSSVDVVLTTGGTGLGPRDVTPEATLNIIDRQVPGFAEVMRLKSFEITPRAILSRAVAGVKGSTLIINLPGSEKGATECLSSVLEVLPHAIELLKGESGDCGRCEVV